ncbi:MULTISPECIES: orotidine-5'-phosphate decarboxylase [Acidithrix]|uniref:Orotidine 5'-phosphate decarboxylase n=1 Tax=Acidithrix ferrooxidans TaxID=1280514 RepID=A0A0D8HG53_9ACTN|nr:MULTISPECIES: orotidine-5'-phosphate decarboxylase [Acidithrix]KJF16797.1 orotidine 5'-phosphate decarboxylase [Acidithrix ferrooxidans]CAG4931133.1 unnamed protein product [Acidithrix sp. C25]
MSDSRLALAIDTDDVVEALRWAKEYSYAFGYAKVGLELFVSEGPSVIYSLRELGYRIFLDLKLHDIPNTVFKAAKVIGSFGVELLTVHSLGGLDMLKAAVEGVVTGAVLAGVAEPPAIIGVTYLTSDSSIDPAGFAERLTLIKDSGARGFVSSGHEVARAKELEPDLFAVVPGIRFRDDARDDQSRVMTPTQALTQGADLLVLGRSVTRSQRPREAIEMLLESISKI